jgi:hypothetical protein
MADGLCFGMFVVSGWLREFEPSQRLSPLPGDYSRGTKLSFSRGQKALL